MNELLVKWNELYLEVIKNFAFYIPFEVIDNEIFYDTMKDLEIEITQEMVDNYIDQFLFIDENFKIQKVDSYQKLSARTIEKSVMLANNCIELTLLKDSLGVSSFKYISEKYLKQVEVFAESTNLLIENYDRFYQIDNLTIKSMFHNQYNFFKTHLDEIESIIGVEHKEIKAEELIVNLSENDILKPFIKKTEQDYRFSHYILSENKIEIENIIIKQYPDARAKEIKFILKHFEEIGLITIPNGRGVKIHSSLKISFGKNIGKYKSIFGTKIDPMNIDYKKFKKELNLILEGLI